MLTTADATPTTQLPAPQQLHRAYATADLEVKVREGKRTVTGLVVPYNVPADIFEVRHGSVLRYREQFAPGSMHRAAQAPFRVQLHLEHDDDLRNRAGYGLSFRDSAEGCIGEFALYPSMADRAIELMETSHRGLSVTFSTIKPVYGSEREGELVTRHEVHTRAVAAVDNPAYADAGVLALREAEEAAAAAQEEADRQIAQMVATMRFQRSNGMALSPIQERWLAERGIELDA